MHNICTYPDDDLYHDNDLYFYLYVICLCYDFCNLFVFDFDHGCSIVYNVYPFLDLFLVHVLVLCLLCDLAHDLDPYTCPCDLHQIWNNIIRREVMLNYEYNIFKILACTYILHFIMENTKKLDIFNISMLSLCIIFQI